MIEFAQPQVNVTKGFGLVSYYYLFIYYDVFLHWWCSVSVCVVNANGLASHMVLL